MVYIYVDNLILKNFRILKSSFPLDFSAFLLIFAWHWWAFTLQSICYFPKGRRIFMRPIVEKYVYLFI